jgi:hypothetical protein
VKVEVFHSLLKTTGIVVSPSPQPPMNSIVTILADLPESLHTSLVHYLDQHPNWDQDQVLTAALSLFLMQNGECGDSSGLREASRTAASVYLDTLFKHSV